MRAPIFWSQPRCAWCRPISSINSNRPSFRIFCVRATPCLAILPMDIGTPEKYKTANVDMLLGQIAACFEGEQRVQGVWVGPGCEIDPSAELIGPVVLGKRCVVGAGARLVGPVVLGDGCEIGPGVHLERAVLWEQVRVGLPTSEPIKVDATIKTDVTQVRNSLVGTGCTIGSGCQLDGVVIADHCMIGFGNMLSHGLKLWPHRTLEPQTITF